MNQCCWCCALGGAAQDRHAAEVVRASDAEVRLAASVIDHLTDEDFRSTELPNPALQHYYAVLHALALGETSDPAQMRLRDATAEGVEDMLRDHPERAAALRAAVQRFKVRLPGGVASFEPVERAGAADRTVCRRPRTLSQCLLAKTSPRLRGRNVPPQRWACACVGGCAVQVGVPSCLVSVCYPLPLSSYVAALATAAVQLEHGEGETGWVGANPY